MKNETYNNAEDDDDDKKDGKKKKSTKIPRYVPLDVSLTKEKLTNPAEAKPRLTINDRLFEIMSGKQGGAADEEKDRRTNDTDSAETQDKDKKSSIPAKSDTDAQTDKPDKPAAPDEFEVEPEAPADTDTTEKTEKDDDKKDHTPDYDVIKSKAVTEVDTDDDAWPDEGEFDEAGEIPLKAAAVPDTAKLPEAADKPAEVNKTDEINRTEADVEDEVTIAPEAASNDETEPTADTVGPTAAEPIVPPEALEPPKGPEPPTPPDAELLASGLGSEGPPPPPEAPDYTGSPLFDPDRYAVRTAPSAESPWYSAAEADRVSRADHETAVNDAAYHGEQRGLHRGLGTGLLFGWLLGHRGKKKQAESFKKELKNRDKQISSLKTEQITAAQRIESIKRTQEQLQSNIQQEGVTRPVGPVNASEVAPKAPDTVYAKPMSAERPSVTTEVVRDNARDAVAPTPRSESRAFSPVNPAFETPAFVAARPFAAPAYGETPAPWSLARPQPFEAKASFGAPPPFEATPFAASIPNAASGSERFTSVGLDTSETGSANRPTTAPATAEGHQTTPEDQPITEATYKAPAGRSVEMSAWHRMEVDDKTGQVVDNPKVPYGEEFKHEQQVERWGDDRKKRLSGIGQKAYGASGGGDTGDGSAAASQLGGLATSSFSDLDPTYAHNHDGDLTAQLSDKQHPAHLTAGNQLLHYASQPAVWAVAIIIVVALFLFGVLR